MMNYIYGKTVHAIAPPVKPWQDKFTICGERVTGNSKVFKTKQRVDCPVCAVFIREVRKIQVKGDRR